MLKDYYLTIVLPECMWWWWYCHCHDGDMESVMQHWCMTLMDVIDIVLTVMTQMMTRHVHVMTCHHHYQGPII